MKSNASFGDYVEVVLGKEKHKGIYLEGEDSSLVLLKLDNGYNIGFNRKDVFEIKKLRSFKEEKKTFEGDNPFLALIGHYNKKEKPKKKASAKKEA